MTMTPVGLSPTTLAENLTEAAGKLMHAQSSLAEAKIKLLEAEHALRDAQTTLTLEGLEGKNAEQRAADLNSKTAAQRENVHQLHITLELAQASHAAARTQWRMCCELNALAALIQSY